MVEVSTEALQSVKDTLIDFQTDINGISQRATNYAEGIVESCKRQIEKTKSDISQSENQINMLKKQIDNLESKISLDMAEYNNLQIKIPQIENNICSVESQIASLNAQISSLKAQLSNAEDDNTRQQLQAQISMLEQKLSQYIANKGRLENELRASQNEKAQLQQSINISKSQKSQAENDLNVQKHRCSNLKGKFERLSASFGRLESQLHEYISATKKFENVSSESVQTKASALDICIRSIDIYLSTNL